MAALIRNEMLYTLKTEIYHFSVSLLDFFVIWAVFKDARFGALAFAVAFFVDVDHLLDYFLAEGCRLDLKSFLSGRYLGKGQRLLIIFHAWEYVLVLFVLYVLTRNPVFASLSIALFSHLCVDVITNRQVVNLGYFITYRVWNSFSQSKICNSIHDDK